MTKHEFLQLLERDPVIAAVKDDRWQEALESPASVLFHLRANLLTVRRQAEEAKSRGKLLFVHLDLAEGIGKDRAGIEFLAECGVSGILSTRNQLIAIARERGLITVQRFFALDSQGVAAITDQRSLGAADVVEIMPGVIGKVIRRVADLGVAVIAGGLIETKEEVTDALCHGALAVSTGKPELWRV